MPSIEHAPYWQLTSNLLIVCAKEFPSKYPFHRGIRNQLLFNVIPFNLWNMQNVNPINWKYQSNETNQYERTRISRNHNNNGVPIFDQRSAVEKWMAEAIHFLQSRTYWMEWNHFYSMLLMCDWMSYCYGCRRCSFAAHLAVCRLNGSFSFVPFARANVRSANSAASFSFNHQNCFLHIKLNGAAGQGQRTTQTPPNKNKSN